MYIIRALKSHTDEYSDLGKFRSNKIAQDTIAMLAEQMSEDLPDGDSIKVFMGINQFTHHPKKGSPIIYYITTD
jgi:hypothetical protein